jgi:hypothetical protein
MKTLVISDIHNKHKVAQRIIESVAHDQRVFLGDYFDDFGDKPSDARDTAIWLKNVEGIKIMGNHDLPYCWGDNPNLACSGYTVYKRIAINDVLDIYDWNKMVGFALVDGWLLSHAGFQPAMLALTDGKLDIPKMEEEWIKAKIAANNGTRHTWHKVSRYRGGRDATSGPFWCDWREFRPTEGVNQIVGHTPDILPRCDNSYLSTNHCIDTHLHHYGMIDDGAFLRYLTPDSFFTK